VRAEFRRYLRITFFRSAVSVSCSLGDSGENVFLDIVLTAAMASSAIARALSVRSMATPAPERHRPHVPSLEQRGDVAIGIDAGRSQIGLSVVHACAAQRRHDDALAFEFRYRFDGAVPITASNDWNQNG
jgi:hypothetical protein